MKKETANYDQIDRQAEELRKLIDETDNVLEDSFLKSVITQSLSADLIEQILIPWPTRLVFNVFKEGFVRKKAKDNLVGYYQQLAVKQNQVIEAQRVVSEQLAQALQAQTEKTEDISERIALLQEKNEQLNSIISRISEIQAQRPNGT